MIAAALFLALQTPSPEPFLSGAWATDDASPVTAISAGLGASGAKRIFTFSSTYMVDALRPTFVGVTERGDTKSGIFEGGRACPSSPS